jgi:hypothetical protein
MLAFFIDLLWIGDQYYRCIRTSYSGRIISAAPKYADKKLVFVRDHEALSL